ncbi:MAG: hypothetical protein KAI66_09025, partial [Lentisphaeria bacterium]|nr:hypothetical protein [Lentisphaeria bacterium]
MKHTRNICILTVGTGTRGPTSQLEAGLAHAIVHHAADLSVLVPSSSEESLLMAEEVAERCEKSRVETAANCFTDPDDLVRSRREFRRLLRSLHLRFPNARLEVNPTSGTKQMTAGAVLATMDVGMASLSFISGPRQDGVVITGQERLVTVDGRSMLAYRAAKDAMMLMRGGSFGAAVLLLEPYEDVLPVCSATASCLQQWQRFAYRDALRLAGRHAVLAPMRGTLDRMANARPFSLDSAADMMAFVDRELSYGHAEEALATLYRLVEHLAKHALAKLGLDPENPSLADIERHLSPPKPLADRLKHQAAHGGRLTIGLAVALELIGTTGSSLDVAFRQDKRIWELLQLRQRTRYGHGNEFVDLADVQELAKRIVT